MHAFRPSLRPTKTYAGYIGECGTNNFRVPSMPAVNGQEKGTARTFAGKGTTQPLESSASSQARSPIGPLKSGSKEITTFIDRLVESDRCILEEVASGLVGKLSRKNLVFFISHMKSCLPSRNVAQKATMEENAAVVAAALGPVPSTKSKKTPTKRAISDVASEAKRRKPASEPANAPPQRSEFYPVAALRTRVEELTNARKKEFLPAVKRTREEEEEFTRLLEHIESKLFFDEENTLNVSDLYESVNEINPLCRKDKDYLAIWQSLHVPPTAQASVASEILKLAPEGIDGAKVLATLTKSMKFKLNQAEILFQDQAAVESAPLFLSKIYPTPKINFGWSRVGWGFSQWLQFVAKILSAVPKRRRLPFINDVLQGLKTLGLQWEDDKIELVWEFTAKQTGTSELELKACGSLAF